MRLGARLATLLVVLLSCPAAGGDPAAVPELLIRWAQGTARPAARLDSLHAVSGLLTVHSLVPRSARASRRLGSGRMELWTRLRFDGRLSVDALLQRYRHAPGVEALQPNYLRRLTRYTTNDPLLDEQWNLDAVGWRSRDPGSAAGVLVAVIDSGVDDEHPDLVQQIWRNPAEVSGLVDVDDDGNGYIDDVAGWDFTDAPGLPGDGDFVEPDADPDDESGHGTHVAGIVAATSDNGVGIAGVAPDVSLMVLRAGFNIGSAGYLQDDDVAAAIVYAADNGAHIINLSLGDPRYSPLLADAVRYATDLDVVVVAAVGNEGSSDVYYPARLDETIGVGAAGRDARPTSFSNHGPSIDLIAPGLTVHSTQPGGRYGDLSGTSMAAPHVAAAAALVRARHPEYSRLQVLGALVSAASDVGVVGWDETSGHGLLRLPAPSAPAPLAATFVRPADRQVSGSTVEVEVHFEAPDAVDYRIDWGRGASTQSWEALADGSLGPGPGAVVAAWQTATLDSGPYTIRVLIQDAGGGAYEDRLVVELVRGGAVLSDLRLTRVLQGPRWYDTVEWTTDRQAPGAVEIIADGELVLRLAEPEGRSEHVVTLPQDLPPGDYRVSVFTGSGSATAQESLRVRPAGVQRWDLASLPQLRDDGYLLPRFADFDGDGRGEVVAMIYGGGAYGATSFFEEDEAFAVFTTSRLFIPWETGDFDLDGRTDLLAVDARRVRVLEPSTTGAYPDRVSWEVRDVWGGEVADLDGDARPEMILRSATGSLFRVFETDGDDSYVETAGLVNETPGENEMGDRQSVGDLDGDGAGEWISGDSDGDLIAFESVGDNAYRVIWTDRVDAGDIDGRLLSAAADLDGDGDEEFISGRLRRDPFDVESRRWTLTVFGATADNEYSVEWQAQVVAGSSSGNGIAITDLDGDGQLEWVVVLVPHLYVFEFDGAGGYEPVWYTQVRRTQRPAVGDLDSDGRQEIVFNRADGGLQTMRWRVPGVELFAPAGWTAVPAGPDRVQLGWEAVPGALAYRIRRDDMEHVQIAATDASAFVYTDSGLTAGREYLFGVVAIDSTGASGHRTRGLTVTPGPLPGVVVAGRQSSRQLTVEFDQPMGPQVAEPFRYRLFPDVAAAEAVIVDRSRRRVVIAFATDLPDDGVVRLVMSGLRSEQGAPLTTTAIDIVLVPLVAATRLLKASATSPLAIAAEFDRPVAVDAAVVVVDGGNLHVDNVRAGERDTSVEIVLSPDTPLRPLGRHYEVTLNGLIDDLGRGVEARVFVSLQATLLDEIIVFPNPANPLTQEMSVAGLPEGSRVRIYNLSGDLVWTGEETDGDGGLQWNGRNNSGEPVAAGIYLLLASHQGRQRRTRIAVLPGR